VATQVADELSDDICHNFIVPFNMTVAKLLPVGSNTRDII
jgi:hypothetical protein